MQNLVRMATYKEHYGHENAFGDPEGWLRKHIGKDEGLTFFDT